MASYSVKLRSGASMPLIGLGTIMHRPWAEKVSLPQEERDKAVIDVILKALEIGYRHFDTAFFYQNESAIGEALQIAFQKGIVKREDVFITTKLPINGMRPDKVRYFLEKSLANLKLSYVDLYLIHLPTSLKYTADIQLFGPFPTAASGQATLDAVDPLETWKILEGCVDDGLARDIGISNFNSQQVQRIYDGARIKPSNNQVECHPYLQQEKLFHFCKRLGITLTAYAPFGSPGKLGSSVLDDPALAEIGKKHGKTSAQIVLRWLVQRGIIVVPKSGNPVRLEQNFNVCDFDLSEEDMAAIKALDCGKRLFSMDTTPGMLDHPQYPFKIEF